MKGVNPCTGIWIGDLFIYLGSLTAMELDLEHRRLILKI
jgi:hypothetical protein